MQFFSFKRTVLLKELSQVTCHIFTSLSSQVTIIFSVKSSHKCYVFTGTIALHKLGSYEQLSKDNMDASVSGTERQRGLFCMHRHVMQPCDL